MARKKASFKSFILGMLFGIIALIGGIAYLGYWTYSSLTINKFESISGQQISFIAEESVLRTLTIQNMIDEVVGIPEMTFQEFTDEYQIEMPTEIAGVMSALDSIKIKEISVNNLLENVQLGYILGSPYSDLETYGVDYTGEIPDGADKLLWEFRCYTVAGDTGLSTYIDNLTVGTVKNVFNLTFPSFINIADETPISDLGSAIDNLTVASFFEDIESEDPMSSSILNAIKTLEKDDNGTMRGYRLNEFGELMTALPQNLYIKDIIDEPDELDTSPVAAILRKIIKDDVTGDYYTLSEINTIFNDLEDKILIKDIISEPDELDTSPVAAILRKIIKDPNTGVYHTLGEMDTIFDDLENQILISDIITEPDELDTSPVAAILRKIIKDADTGVYHTLGEINTIFDGLEDEILIKDIITEPEASDTSPVAAILRKIIKDEDTGIYYTLSEMDTILNGLGDDILIRDIIAEPSAEAGYMATNIITILRDMQDDELNYYTINTINDMFEKLPQEMTIQDIIEEPVGDSLANDIMHDIWADNASLDDLSTSITNVIDNLTIQDIIDEPVGDTLADNILHDIWLTNSSLDNISTNITNVINDLHFQDIMDAPDTTTFGGRILNEIYTENPLITNVSPTITNVINGLTIKDVIDEPDTGTVFGNIMHKIWVQDLLITNLSSGLSDDDFEIGDILILPEDTTSISYRIISLMSGTNPDTGNPYKLDELSDAIDDAIDELTLGDIFGGQQTGIVSLFGATTKITDFNSAALAQELGNKTLSELEAAGIITGPINPTYEDYTLNQIITLIGTLP